MTAPLHRPLAGFVLLAGVALDAFAGGDDCRLTLDTPSVDFGVFNRLLQSSTAPEYLLGEQHLSLTLNCQSPRDMSLFYRALGAGSERYRFAEHGDYRLRLHNGLVDGQPVELGLIGATGQPPAETASQLTWRPGLGVSPVRGGQPVHGKSFSLQIDLRAWAREPALRVRDAITWDASGLFETAAGATSRELQLHAGFAPTACSLSLSNGGLVDFGHITRAQLNTGQPTHLAPKSLTLSIGCDAPALFALRMVDNRQGTATVNSEIYYGLGLDHSANKIGLYALQLDPADASADGFSRLYRTDSTSAGVAWSSSNTNPITIGATSYLGFSHLAGSTAGPVAIQNLSSRVTVEAIIAPTDSLDLNQEVQLDGSATLEIIYL